MTLPFSDLCEPGSQVRAKHVILQGKPEEAKNDFPMQGNRFFTVIVLYNKLYGLSTTCLKSDRLKSAGKHCSLPGGQLFCFVGIQEKVAFHSFL